MQTDRVTIGVCGLWHLGCVLCAAWTELGYRVVGFDPDPDRVANLSRGKPPLFEPGLEGAITNAIQQGLLCFTDDLEELKRCDFVFIAFDTPVLEDDRCDLSPLQRTVDGLSRVLRDEAVVIVSSQTPAGTCLRFRSQLRQANPTVELVYSPENLRLGQAIECYLKPGRIILGAETEAAQRKTINLFSTIEAQVIAMNLCSAEMVKHAINSFLANSIVFADHMADLCEMTGANIRDVVKGMKSDARIGEKAYLSPGIGFSGGTLGRDLQVLSQLRAEQGRKAMMCDVIIRFNSERKQVIVKRIAGLCNGRLKGKVIAVLGLTYKPGTSTLRRSLPLEIVRLLIEKGASIKAYDPRADYGEMDRPVDFTICQSIEDALRDSDLALLLTEWPQFKDYDWGRCGDYMKRKQLFDTKNFLADNRLEENGVQYFGIGLGRSSRGNQCS